MSSSFDKFQYDTCSGYRQFPSFAEEVRRMGMVRGHNTPVASKTIRNGDEKVMCNARQEFFCVSRRIFSKTKRRRTNQTAAKGDRPGFLAWLTKIFRARDVDYRRPSCEIRGRYLTTQE